MPAVNIDHIAMPTANAERLIEFYKRLGFTINDETEWRAGEASIFSIQVGSSKINVHPEGFTASLRGPTAVPGCGDVCFVWEGSAEDCKKMLDDAGVEITELGVTPAQVAAVQKLVDDKVVNDKLARQVFDGLLAGEGTPAEIVEKRGLAVVSDDGALSTAVDNAIVANPDVADKIRDGKVAAAGALIGAVMKEMRGQADAARVRELILEKLS